MENIYIVNLLEKSDTAGNLFPNLICSIFISFHKL